MILNQKKRNLKIVLLYVVSVVCIIGYLWMKNFNFINILYEKSSEFFPIKVTGRFITFVFAGLLQYGLLVFGVCIFTVLTFMLIREKIKNN